MRGRSILLLVGFTLGMFTGIAHAQHLGKDFWFQEVPMIFDNDHYAIAIVNPDSTDAADVDVISWNPDACFPDPVPCDVGPSSPIPAGDCEVILLDHAPNKYCFPVPCTNLTPYPRDPVYHVIVNDGPPVAVYAVNPWEHNEISDGTMILPIDNLGTEYRVGSYVAASNTRNTFLTVVATQDGTDVTTFEPPLPSLAVDDITLNQGEYFVRINGSDPADDLTGWRIVASAPVSVITGMECTSIGGRMACDHLEEMLLPEEEQADLLVVCPTRTRPREADDSPCAAAQCSPDIFRFVAIANGTNLTTSPAIPGCDGASLDAGSWVECYSDTPFIITSNNKPFYGYQYLVSMYTDFPPLPEPGTGDPAMINVLPLNKHACSAHFVTPDPNDPPLSPPDLLFPYDYITVTKTTASSLELDGSSVTGECAAAGSVNGVAYECCALSVDDGCHELTSSPDPVGVVAMGFRTYDSYGYAVGRESYCALDGPYERECPGDVAMKGMAVCPECVTPTYSWWASDPSVTFDPVDELETTATADECGEFTICLNVDCGAMFDVQCCTTLNVYDNDPPVVTKGSIEPCYPTEAEAVTAAIAATDAEDNCGIKSTTTTVEYDPNGCDVTIRVTVTDVCDNEAFVEYETRIDGEAPSVGAPGDLCLWPPNHKYVCFENFTEMWSIEDNCPGALTYDVECESDQCDDAPCPEHPGENGDGHTTQDCRWIYDQGTDRLCVRSERAGTDPEGRHYTISLIVTDQCGNEGTSVEPMTIYVPHDQSPHEDCISPEPGQSCCQ
ncbi:IgGFc-binding protein [Acidobacteriota bacterium]